MRSEKSYRQSTESLRFKHLLLLLPSAVAALSTVMVAQVPTNSPNTVTATAEQTDSQTAPVTIDGEILFRLGGVSALPPEKRAGNVSQAIEALARDTSYKPGTLQIVQEHGYLKDRGRQPEHSGRHRVGFGAGAVGRPCSGTSFRAANRFGNSELSERPAAAGPVA